MWKKAKKGIENFFFPIVYCALCGDKTSLHHLGLCHRCLEALAALDDHYVLCDLCGNFYHRHFHSCPRCFQHKRPRSYRKAVACYPYEKEAKELVKKLKFQNGRYLAEAMAKLMVAKEDLAEGGKYTALVAVPLSAARFREREYNQSAELAKALRDYTGITYLPGVLKKIKETPRQSDLSGTERRNNLTDAFALGEKKDLHGRYVVLIDDVITTGATVNECAKVLKRGGAKGVKVVTFCGTGLLKD